VPLRAEIATPQGKRRYVRRLFATIADRYDLITVVLSYGLDRGWKRRLAGLARVAPAAARSISRAARRHRLDRGAPARVSDSISRSG
jgi:hypothetical protein